MAIKQRKSRRQCGCGKRFYPKRENQVHCSPTCRSREAQREWRRKAKVAREVANV